MNRDIVERLRGCILGGVWRDLLDPAADEITRLRAELAAEREMNEANRASLVHQHKMIVALNDEAATACAERAALRAQLDEAREALAFYANKQVYEPDSVGRSSDLTFRARAVLDKIKGGGDE